ncbi:hypothetical protein BH23PLA1_BH23PLA1_35610 [soil metagenome]
MSRLPLTPDQAELSDRIYQTLRQNTDADLRFLADLLSSKPDRQLLGQTEFEVRDRVHQIGASARSPVQSYACHVRCARTGTFTDGQPPALLTTIPAADPPHTGFFSD